MTDEVNPLVNGRGQSRRAFLTRAGALVGGL
ncbi:MAG: hypothetical protein RLZZ621_207, partial [Gemmatimonadota bacterium]